MGGVGKEYLLAQEEDSSGILVRVPSPKNPSQGTKSQESKSRHHPLWFKTPGNGKLRKFRKLQKKFKKLQRSSSCQLTYMSVDIS